MSRDGPKGAMRVPRAGASIDAVKNLQVAHQALVRQRSSISNHIEQIENLIRVMGVNSRSEVWSSLGHPKGPDRGPERQRGSGRLANGNRPGSLKDLIHKVLASARSPMKIANITESVLKSGYKTKNKTLANSVSVALADMIGVRKVSRGTYELA